MNFENGERSQLICFTRLQPNQWIMKRQVKEFGISKKTIW
jgi:hypothetical protein